ncbi:MAG: hypothetical protein JNG86_15385 [Verrucomicrobiaceae bacterium]|nr:hypothetical protein [Verrucomicrobiaceae bacterium]
MSLPPPDLPAPADAKASTPAPALIPTSATALRKQQAEPLDEPPDLDTYPQLLRDALTYPWRRGGPYILVPGAFLALAFTISAFAPFVGLVSAGIGGCYFAAFYFQIVESTYAGRHRVPDWPEFSDLYDDLVRPGLQMAAIFVVCGLLAYLALLGVEKIMPLRGEQDVEQTAGWLWEIVFSFYFPMAVIGVVLNGHVGGALPHRVLPAIVRCMPGYLLGVASLTIISMGVGLLQDQVKTLSWIGILPGWLLTICLLVMQARLTGTLGLRYAQKVV